MARVAFFGVKTKLVIDTFTVAPKATPWRASTRSKESNVDLRTMRIKRSFLCRLANRTGRVLRTKLVWGLSSPDRVLAPRKRPGQSARASAKRRFFDYGVTVMVLATDQSLAAMVSALRRREMNWYLPVGWPVESKTKLVVLIENKGLNLPPGSFFMMS